MSDATLRLKMSVSSVNRSADSNGEITGEQIQLQAVYGPEGSPNAQWSKWTPSGTLSFNVSNPGAFGRVLPGQFYFVDLIQTTKEAI
jgi:hypothetical protein